MQKSADAYAVVTWRATQFHDGSDRECSVVLGAAAMDSACCHGRIVHRGGFDAHDSFADLGARCDMMLSHWSAITALCVASCRHGSMSSALQCICAPPVEGSGVHGWSLRWRLSRSQAEVGSSAVSVCMSRQGGRGGRGEDWRHRDHRRVKRWCFLRLYRTWRSSALSDGVSQARFMACCTPADSLLAGARADACAGRPITGSSDKEGCDTPSAASREAPVR